MIDCVISHNDEILNVQSVPYKLSGVKLEDEVDLILSMHDGKEKSKWN